MKVAILGDTHFGVRNDSQAFHDLFRKFYVETFFPYLEEHGITHVIQTGDLFDRRKYVNFNSLRQAREYFFDPLVEKNIRLYVIIGNHDIFYKNTLEVNSMSMLLDGYDNISIFQKPELLVLNDQFEIDMIPWICDENREDVINFIKKSKCPYCVGHFELNGFEMDRGNYFHGGWDKSILGNYSKVFSGHFHHRSEIGNILYVGSPNEHTWIDYADNKGFHVLDTITGEVEFITNTHTIFRKIGYNDEELYFDDVTKHDFSEFGGKYVKVVVVKKTNEFLFETFMDKMTRANPIDVSIVEDFADVQVFTNGEEIDQAEDTLSIIDKVVDGIELEIEKPKLKSMLRAIYTEALATE